MYMDKISIDVIQNCIFNRLDFLMQIRLRQVCKWFYRLEIHDMYYIGSEYLLKLTDNILANHFFVRYLCAKYNRKITNVKHMTKLEKLNVGFGCGINDDGIKHINPIELYTTSNSKITRKI